ncbi:MAG: MFS transporter [Microbacterium sp.]
MVYLPTIVFSLGEGAVIPLIPVVASSMGADITLAALVSSALVVGQLCGNLPAGWAVSRIGERFTMVIAGIIAILAGLAMVLASSPAVLAASVFLLGVCAAAFGLARHAFMTTRVPEMFRARALSLLGGSFRLGVFIGPFVAAGLLQLFASETAAFCFFLICLIVMVALVLFGPDPEKPKTDAGPILHPENTGESVTGSIPTIVRTGVLRTMWRQRSVLGRLGLAAASLSAVRSARQVLLPLWGISLDLDASTIALIVGVSGAIDFTLFYASGQVMDRFGRLWAAMPAMVLMGAGFLALSMTHDANDAVLWFGAFAAVLGIGNGLSSGILLTLGADVAPKKDPAAFLGSWRTLTDAGGAVAPLVISAVTALFSLPVAAATIGVVSLAGAAGFLRWIPVFVPGRRT